MRKFNEGYSRVTFAIKIHGNHIFAWQDFDGELERHFFVLQILKIAGVTAEGLTNSAHITMVMK